MTKRRHLVVWTDAAPGADVIQLGAMLFDEFFVEQYGGWSAYIRPGDPATVPQSLMEQIGTQDPDKFAIRMLYWEFFRDTWKQFGDWLMKHTGTKTFAEASHAVVWCGLEMPQIMADLADSCRRYDIPFFVEGMPLTVSLTSVTRHFELVAAYLGQQVSVGNTFEEICAHCSIKPPTLNDALRKSVAIGQAFHFFLTLYKRAFGKAASY